MLLRNVDRIIFETFCELSVEYFCISHKFEIPLRSCRDQQNSFANMQLLQK